LQGDGAVSLANTKLAQVYSALNVVETVPVKNFKNIAVAVVPTSVVVIAFQQFSVKVKNNKAAIHIFLFSF
jgi:hypothetical protein